VNVFTERIVLALGPSSRIFDQLRERERERTMTHGVAARGNSPRED
jgi:hypothetical protein